MTLSTNVVETRILCSFRFSIREYRDTWVIKIRVFRKVFSKQIFAVLEAEDNTSGLLNRESIAGLPSWGPSFWEEIDSFALLA